MFIALVLGCAPAVRPHVVDCKSTEDAEASCDERKKVANVVVCKTSERQLLISWDLPGAATWIPRDQCAD
jgi:hypothetical protein